MARILIGCAAAAALTLGTVSPSSGFWLDAFVDHVHTGYCVNMRWPSPYVCPDRASARAPFYAMVRNGWRRQNLLGSHHFNADSTELTQSGKLKVRWIMTQTPPAYRQVFVERSMERAVTDRRMETVQQFTNDVAEQIASGETPPLVTETHIVSEGRPAATVDYVTNQFRDNMRLPVLPASSGIGGNE